MALDFHVSNVTCTYTLEHKSIDDLFDSISDCLNVLMEKEESTSKQLQELVFCIGTIQALICQHMLKEEKQVPLFTLLHSLYFSSFLSLYREFKITPVSLLYSNSCAGFPFADAAILYQRTGFTYLAVSL